MITKGQIEPAGFYFALPRLVIRYRGGTATASDGSAAEAYLASGAIFILTYLAAWHLLGESLTGWAMAIGAIVLVFAVWIFWLSVFFFVSLIIKFLRMLGFFRRAPKRNAQDIFIALILTVFALQLSGSPGWTRWIGILFLVALAANLLAATLLGLQRRRI